MRCDGYFCNGAYSRKIDQNDGKLCTIWLVIKKNALLRQLFWDDNWWIDTFICFQANSHQIAFISHPMYVLCIHHIFYWRSLYLLGRGGVYQFLTPCTVRFIEVKKTRFGFVSLHHIGQTFELACLFNIHKIWFLKWRVILRIWLCLSGFGMLCTSPY